MDEIKTCLDCRYYSGTVCGLDEAFQFVPDDETGIPYPMLIVEDEPNNCMYFCAEEDEEVERYD